MRASVPTVNLVCQIAEAAPYFSKFEGLWPVHDMIAGYLLNAQTRRRKDLRLEKLADGGDTGGDDGDDEMTVSFRVESDSDDMEVKETGSKRKSTKYPVDPPLSKKVEYKTRSKRESTEDLVDLPPPKKAPIRAAKASKKASPALTWSDIPSTCPTVMCEEEVPEQPNPCILSLFVKHQELVEQVGLSGPGVAFLNLQICAAITQENRRDQVSALGRQNDWPRQIDYATLPERILKLRKQVLEIIQDETVLRELPVWQDFLRNIDHKIFQFSDSRSKLAFTYALYGRRCGCYGPRGEFLINSAIIRLLSGDDVDSLSTTLFDTLHAIVLADATLLDPYNETSNLIELRDFISFILTPSVAALLIAEDMDIPMDKAHDVRDDSNEFGDVMQPDDDGDGGILEDLHRANIRAMKGSHNAFFSHPPRHRKQRVDPSPAPEDINKVINKNKVPRKTGLKSNKTTLTLDDFREPGPKKSKAKKAPANGNKPQVTQDPKKPVKTNSIKSDYGTRSRTRAT
ncbi:hypothetical protein B0H13DRAFT_1858928 [Mycena leptocephala]|nr:hypothetical protein B0H13DRAFT_1858928 [Mycena leptocephala]